MAESVPAIPEDIDRIATDLVRADYSGEDDPDWQMYRAIAEALLSERKAQKERDARLVERLNAVINIGKGGEVRYITMAEVANAIRQDTPNETEQGNG